MSRPATIPYLNDNSLNWTLILPNEVRRKLRVSAARRGMTTDRLACVLLERAVADNLVEAILDD